MLSIKRGYTLIELMVVFAVIAILSTIVAFGIRKTGEDEGVKSDYLIFYENVKSLKLRANLGKQNVVGMTSTSVQTLEFRIGQSSYLINGVSVAFKNKAKFVSVSYNGAYSGSEVVRINFYPYNLSTLPLPTSFGCIDCAPGSQILLTSGIIINIGKDISSKIFPISISANGYLIGNVGTGNSVFPTAQILPTSTPTPTQIPVATLTPTPTPVCAHGYWNGSFCSCDSGYTNCGGTPSNACVDLNTNILNCGSCGYMCGGGHIGFTCSGGICYGSPTSTPTPTPDPNNCPEGQTMPHYESSRFGCLIIEDCGYSNCTP